MTKPSANRVKLFEFKFEIVYLYFQSFKLDIFKLENVKNQVQKDRGPAGAWGLSKIKIYMIKNIRSRISKVFHNPRGRATNPEGLIMVLYKIPLKLIESYHVMKE